MIYLQESEFDCGINDDPIFFPHVIDSDNSKKWIDVMKDELKSMKQNKVWDLVNVGFSNIIHVVETIKQNYSRVSMIPLNRSRVV